jgi:hypothetical protein
MKLILKLGLSVILVLCFGLQLIYKILADIIVGEYPIKNIGFYCVITLLPALLLVLYIFIVPNLIKLGNIKKAVLLKNSFWARWLFHFFLAILYLIPLGLLFVPTMVLVIWNMYGIGPIIKFYILWFSLGCIFGLLYAPSNEIIGK